MELARVLDFYHQQKIDRESAVILAGTVED
jgi:hypothetical protein